MKYALTFLVIFYSLSSFAQGDFILLRKDNVVIQSYVKDSYLKCQLNNGQWIEGRIKKIKADSLFLEQIQVRQVASIFGTPMLDTMRYGLAKFSINDVHLLPKKEHGISVVNDGSLFMLGAGGYAVLNIINGLTQPNQSVTSNQNLINLGIAAGVFMFGEILHWTHRDYITLGKKYQLYSTATIPSK